MLLHDSLDVLPTNTDNSLVVLVWNMERDGGRHLLLDQAKTLLHRVITGGHNVDVEIVLVEAIEDDLNIA